MQLTDTCAEGDGERNNINQKRLLSYFFRFISFSKYAITSIAQVEALLSEEVAHRVTWGKFVNWTESLGNNIEGDKAQDFCNCTSKNVVQGMGPNKTNNAIITASKAARGIHQIKGQFDKVTKIHPSSRAHTTRSAKDDEMLMLKDLSKLRPFHITPKRLQKLRRV